MRLLAKMEVAVGRSTKSTSKGKMIDQSTFYFTEYCTVGGLRQ